MKNTIAALAALFLLWSSVPRAQDAPAGTPPDDSGLNDLAAMTFGCPKAALNAAAREAAKVRSQGTYQFSYFRIVSNSHHAAYEVSFKSNYQGEKELKYCVAMYCQQGWDPKTARMSVTWMNDPHQAPGAHGASCSVKPSQHSSPP